LENDPDLVTLLQHRWPYILEDEAQDSSILQEKILRLLVGTDGNWVRVGDPNQAIYASFTTANPNLLKSFLEEPGVRKEDLPESGRSCQSIINLANGMIDWVEHEHPNHEVRDALTPPFIQQTKPGDPQPNPPDDPGAVEFVNWQMSDQAELDFLVERVQAWLEKNPKSTVVVLAFLNDRVAKIADALRGANIPVVDSLMNLPDPTRLSAGAIANIFESLLNPDNPKKLATTFKVWKRKFREDPAAWDQIEAGARLIQRCPALENYIYPQNGADWLESLKVQHQNELLTDLAAFREVVHRWHQAAYLPPDQLILAVAQDLELDAVELATIHKIALLIRNLQDMHPEWSLEDLNSELVDITKNLRRFENLSDETEGFDPQAHTGHVVVATMHKAKGLEWDKVFLTSANNYDYPSGEEGEVYRAESYYLRDNLNLQAEALAQLKNLAEGLPIIDFRLGAYSLDDRNEVIRERLRLFYVGITRTRRSLTVSYNTGRSKKNKEAFVCTVLRNRINEGG
jgi:DNA helicase-2/ATP-dependent DNA helicase PcrA